MSVNDGAEEEYEKRHMMIIEAQSVWVAYPHDNQFKVQDS
jgi:hypothetical protein